MNRTSPRALVLCVLLVALLLALPVVAQSNPGSLSGTVTDTNNAVIANATITITNIGTNQTTRLTTSDQGAFTLPNLPPALYRVKAEAGGFKSALIDNVKVDTASATTINIALEVGAPAETVTITAEAALINAESGAQNTTLTERMIRDLPVANRNVLELTLTVPNVSGLVGTEDPEISVNTPSPGSALNINGGRPGESSILADGVTNTGASIARQVVSFSPDVVQEVTVQTSSFSAEYGRTGGGIINTTTKSGTNEYHGLAAWNNRNPIFNAKDYNPRSTVGSRDSLRENRGTFTFGGPVWLPKKIFGPLGYDGHHRTFFFASFEPRRRSDGETEFLLLPDEGMRRGDFSNVALVPGGYVRRDVATRLLGLRVRRVRIVDYDRAQNCKGKPETERDVVFDTDLRKGANGFPGTVRGGEWRDGWRVTGHDQRLVWDAGYAVRNGYFEFWMTADAPPSSPLTEFRGKVHNPDVHWAGVSGSADLAPMKKHVFALRLGQTQEGAGRGHGWSKIVVLGAHNEGDSEKTEQVIGDFAAWKPLADGKQIIHFKLEWKDGVAGLYLPDGSKQTCRTTGKRGNEVLISGLRYAWLGGINEELKTAIPDMRFLRARLVDLDKAR